MSLKLIVMRRYLFITLFCLGSQILLAEEITVTTTDNVELYVSVNGSGPYCLYLHGGPGAGSNWLEMFVGDQLEKRFTMVYLDQRGTDRSGSPSDGDYSMERLVADFEEIRKQLGIEKWFTLGHSFGGMLQMGYWERHPEVISGMIFCNCCLWFDDSITKSWLPKAAELMGPDESHYILDENIDPIQRVLAAGPLLNESNMQAAMFYKDKQEMELINSAYHLLPATNRDMSQKALLCEDYRKNFFPLTATVTCPVLFFYGTRDWPIGPDHYRHAIFPEMILRGAEVSHMPFLSESPLLLGAIDDYLQDYSLRP